MIGKAVSNYEVGSIASESPVIQAVYYALKEVEMPRFMLYLSRLSDIGNDSMILEI